jgi:hypothetical protein
MGTATPFCLPRAGQVERAAIEVCRRWLVAVCGWSPKGSSNRLPTLAICRGSSQRDSSRSCWLRRAARAKLTEGRTKLRQLRNGRRKASTAPLVGAANPFPAHPRSAPAIGATPA